MSHPVVRGLRAAGCVLLAALSLLGGAYAFVHGGGNFHEVERGAVYRSSWLGAAGLEKTISLHGVKSVLNLCGEHPGDGWFDGETSVARRRGVVFRSLSFSANTELDARQMAQLVDFLREAPRPLLIHCRAGSDRTGLACAVYVALRGGSCRDAREQLSMFYGHFPYLGSKSAAMDATLERFYPTLANRQIISQVASK